MANTAIGVGNMKTALLIVGILLFAYGLHWIGQGTGWLPSPLRPASNDNASSEAVIREAAE